MPAPLRLLGVRDVLFRVGFSRTHLWRLVAAGEFPAPLKFGRRVYWPEAEVEAWLAAVIATAPRGGPKPSPESESFGE